MDPIEEVLTRGVENVYPTRQELEKVLRSGKKLKLYQGFDPTGDKLHLGHMIGLRKLRQFQKLGHHVIFLIGDGTGQAGDPSGKFTARNKFMTQDQLRQNAADYVKQAANIVDFKGRNPVEILYNNDWLGKLVYTEMLNIFGHFSVQQLLERDLFQERMKKGEDVNIREFLYPVFQAYDSVAMKVDLEIGGSDQTFNMLAGRRLVKSMQGRDKFVLTTPLLTDSQGRKIGKTEGNIIALTDKPEDLFGKIMSLADDIIVKGLEYLTDVPIGEINEIGKSIEGGQNPMPYKKKLAFEIVAQLNNQSAAQKAQDSFESTFQKGQKPENLETIEINNPKVNLIDFLIENHLAESKSAAKRLVDQSAIEIEGQTAKDQTAEFKNGQVVKIGKKRFIRVKVNS